MTRLPTQSGTIPYRIADSGAIEVLLVTSRKRGRWILPKGKVARGMLAHRSAERETFQEAGVLGNIEHLPFAELTTGTEIGVDSGTRVLMFPLVVTSVLMRWPEDHQRKRQWMPVDKAIKQVDSPALRKLLKHFALRASV